MIRKKIAVILLCSAFLFSCSVLKKKSDDNDVKLAKAMQENPLTPEESKELMKDMAGNWFYGHGVGSSMLQVGTIVVFPPYALVAVGNAALNVMGYESIGVGTVLPEDGKKEWDSMYDSVTAGPGRLTSAIAGKEFVTRDIEGETLARYVKTEEPKNSEKLQESEEINNNSKLN